jgi:hypothetical protein
MKVTTAKTAAEASGNRRRVAAPAPDGGAPPRRPRGRIGATLLGLGVGIAVGGGALASLRWWDAWSAPAAPAPAPRPAAPSAAVAAPRPTATALARPPDPPEPPDDSTAPEAPEPDAPASAAAPKPWEGPWLGALAHQTPIYPTARFSRNRLGYVRRGTRVAAHDKPIRTSSCKQGFYPLEGGGFVCGKYATLDASELRERAPFKPPDLAALLPYRYAFNREHGTPLYHVPPEREAMMRYEPYLEKKESAAADPKGEATARNGPAKDERAPKRDADAHDGEAPESETGAGAAGPSPSASAAGTATAVEPPALAVSRDGEPRAAASAAPSVDAAESEVPAELPWWQRPKGEKVKLKLADLEESDGVLARRMVRGFFIAIDGTFGHEGRLWYRTTGGLVAPADRMILPKTPSLSGIELEGGLAQAGFVRNVRAHKYRFDVEGKPPRRAGKLERFAAATLTGKTTVHGRERYRETTEGWWLREEDATFTEPGPRPSEVGDAEKWIDVNLGRKTLVAFVGDKPVFATLVAPGKRSAVKAKDHRTKVGKFRIREKHITSTMDGDGPTGDLPYSIEDVPYVQFYDGSYALHGAFWHENFGREQSHGCVNLAPADAKRLFAWTEPALPDGWHGVFASDKRKGTMVVIRE